jgi:hypothetical protein
MTLAISVCTVAFLVSGLAFVLGIIVSLWAWITGRRKRALLVVPPTIIAFAGLWNSAFALLRFLK